MFVGRGVGGDGDDGKGARVRLVACRYLYHLYNVNTGKYWFN